MSQSSPDAFAVLFAKLSRALARDEPEQALDGCLTILRDEGLLSDTTSAHAFELSLGEQTLPLCLAAHLSAETAEVLENLLRVAAQRVAGNQRCRHAVERMNMLSHASFEGIMIHDNGVVIDANERLAELVGARREELLGDGPLRSCVAPEDMASVEKRVTEGYEGAYVITAIRKDGTRFRAELLSKQGKLGNRPVRVAAVRDVTEREETLALLRESEIHLRDLAETMFDVTVLSRNLAVIDISGNLHSLFGRSREEMLGRSLLEFAAVSAQDVVKRMIAEQRSCRYEATVVHRSGELIPVEIVGIDSTVDGKLTRVSGLRDMRAVRRLEEERQQLQRQIERSARLDSLGVLAGGIAHDFNNLLVGVLGNADLLLMGAVEPDNRETIEAIIAAAQQAAALTARLLTYAGRGEGMHRSPIELGGLLRELCVLLAPKLNKARVAFDIEADGRVLADKSALSQVLMNLLTNASDALGETDGQIDVRVKRIHHPDSRWEGAVGATVGPGNWLLVEIQDSGSGMDGATLERIFEPFFTTKQAGHGLGLAACVGIVSGLGGAIRVDSEPGEGSRVSLLLPETEPGSIEGLEVPSLRSSNPCRVLVVDDDSIVRAQLRRSLELRAYHVTEADSGAAGLAAYQAGAFDLIILDMTMPDMDGAQVVRKLRALGASTPILLASGYVDAATERRLQPGSFQGFLRKPFAVHELLRAVESARRTTVPPPAT